jgi:endonuclease VIII
VPEGDTIRRLANKIQDRFAGQRCLKTVTRDPRLVGIDFSGATLRGAEAVGKHLLIRFDDGRTLHAHLLMTGSWKVGPTAAEPAWRRRVELWFENGRLTGLDVPIFHVLPTSQEHTLIGHLGPDLCADQAPDVQEITDRLLRMRDVPLAAALLDQHNVAGFGNLYAVEVPFIVGVSPNQVVGTVGVLDVLVGFGTALIRTNAGRGPQNTTGRKLTTDDHWIYPKRGRPCPLCETRLDGWAEGKSPWKRVSTWCPTCQPLEAIRAVDDLRARRLLALHPASRDPSYPSRPRSALPMNWFET